MPRTDLMEAPADARALAPRPVTLSGWGGGEGAFGWAVRPDRASQMGAAVDLYRSRGYGGVIAGGMGRSYGDSAQLEGGLVLETRGLKAFEVDARAGLVDADAGVTL